MLDFETYGRLEYWQPAPEVGVWRVVPQVSFDPVIVNCRAIHEVDVEERCIVIKPTTFDTGSKS